jgi:phosphatidylserine/phosphatidylglycerophosphate/cardiolipin synthase-like enzyme
VRMIMLYPGRRFEWWRRTELPSVCRRLTSNRRNEIGVGMKAYDKVSNLSIIIQPGDSFFPIVAAIDSATRTINMTIFRMDDPIVRDAMKNAVARGVRVRALVALESKGWEKRNRKLTDDLASMGIEVSFPKRWEQQKGLTRYHYKILTIDDDQCLILTFNPTRRNLHYARDFGVLVKDGAITSELNRLFDADWEGSAFTPTDLPLVISAYNSRAKLLKLLKSATRSIHVMDAKLSDQEMMVTLLQKAAAGCDVKVIGRDIHFDEIVPNFHARRLARYKLHAKCIVTDGYTFFIGSQNLRRTSLERRREVGIIIADEAMAHRIERVFDEDWTNAT